MSYLDRKALLESIGYIPEGTISDYDAGRWDIRQKIIEAPAVDAVEVVRCKDCIHYREISDIKYNGEPAKMCVWHSQLRNENFYCSDGARKV